MTKRSSETGKIGEDIAYAYLKNNHYSIIERNFREKWGEIDIVAKHKDGTLIFVEVKTMQENENLNPEDHLTRGKLERLQRTASLYANHHTDLVSDKKGWRIDLVAIEIKNDGVNNLRHFENI